MSYRRKNWRRYYGFKPYGRNSLRGRYRFTRDSFRTVGSTAKKALGIAKYVKSIVNVEYKQHRFALSAAVGTTPSINGLTRIAQGDGDDDRNGNSIKLKSIQCKWIINGNTSAESTFLRMLIVLDKDWRGTNLTTAGGTDDSLLTDQDMIAPRDLNNKKRFVIIYDKTYGMSNNGRETITGKFFKKFNMQVTYDGSALGDLRSNQLFLVIFSDQATNTPTVKLSCRSRYVDN